MKTRRITSARRKRALRERDKRNKSATNRDFMFEELNRLPRAFELARRIEEDADELRGYCDTMDEDADFMRSLPEQMQGFIQHELHELERKILIKYKRLK